jgi:phage terminase large subunit
MVLGKWVAFEGMVYDNFDANIHVIARPKSWAKWGNYPPPDWPRFRSIDFGYRNPFVCQWWVKDPDGVFILYREIYMTGRTVKQHAGQIKQCEELEVAAARVQIVRENEERTKAGLRPLEMPESVYVTLSVADHDAEDIATLIENDIGAQPAEKDVTPGIQSVYEMLQPRLIGDEMKPALLICNDALVEVDVVLENEGKATCLRQEIASYRYEPPKEGVEKAPKEVPMKVGDHACDAMRYAIHTGRMVGSLDIIFI